MKLERKLKTIAKSSSPAKIRRRKVIGIGKTGIPRRKYVRKGVEYHNTRAATAHPEKAPTSP